MRHAFATLALAAVAAVAQAGVVEVRFVEPHKFSDAGTGPALEQVQTELTRHLERLGRKALPASQSLRVEFTDVDLAGTIEPVTRRATEIRVLRGRADWPRLNLRYTLHDGARVIGQGDEQLTDMNYLFFGGTERAGDAEPLRYEKRMLTQWFMQRFAGPH